MDIVEKMEKVLSLQLQQLEKHRLRRAFLPLQTAEDLARLQQRLSTVSTKEGAASRKERCAKKYMKADGSRADGLRGATQLLEASERVRRAILLAVLCEV